MAEASGGRTHRRQEDLPPAGFEDRDDHRTACASMPMCGNPEISIVSSSCARSARKMEHSRYANSFRIDSLCGREDTPSLADLSQPLGLYSPWSARSGAWSNANLPRGKINESLMCRPLINTSCLR